jgi:integrase
MKSSMSRIRPYVHHWIDNRHGRAKGRYFFRRRGFKQVPLPGMPGQPQFEEAYQATLAGTPLPSTVGAKRVRVGSIDALVLTYFGSPAFMALKPSTQQIYRGIVEAFTKEHGSKPLALLTRQHIEMLLARKAKTPGAAAHWLRMIKTLMKFAVRSGMRTDDPARDVEFIQRKIAGFHTWTESEIEQFESAHPVGSKARLALALLLYTAQRRGDVVRMGRQHIRNGAIAVVQAKTGKPLMIPIHPTLQTIIEASPSEHLTLLTTFYGQPFTADGFGNWFRKQCDAAGLPKHCSAHGLRKAACRRLAEAGCSANVIASISGHKTLREVERYTKAADQERMARQGMAAMVKGIG